MKNRKMRLPLILGLVLILCSLGLVVFSQVRMHMGTEHCRQVTAKLLQLLPERTPGVPDLYPDPAMPVLEVDGTDYVAILELPTFSRTLPVADSWDSSKLPSSPARFSGSAYDGTLILGGADHPQQFGFCDTIEHGTPVTLTDMTGAQYHYTVSRIDRASHADAQWLQRDGFDLVLFCRDALSFEYVAVRCTFSGDL